MNSWEPTVTINTVCGVWWLLPSKCSPEQSVSTQNYPYCILCITQDISPLRTLEQMLNCFQQLPWHLCCQGIFFCLKLEWSSFAKATHTYKFIQNLAVYLTTLQTFCGVWNGTETSPSDLKLKQEEEYEKCVCETVCVYEEIWKRVW